MMGTLVSSISSFVSISEEKTSKEKKMMIMTNFIDAVIV